MGFGRNIFCASQPLYLTDVVWHVLTCFRSEINFKTDFSDDIIFLPTRRAVRNVEKMISEKSGGNILLPRLVALGDGIEADDDIASDDFSKDVTSNTEREIILSQMIMAGLDLGYSGAMPVARDLVRMMDYLENEKGAAACDINWPGLVDENFAEHFKEKARFFGMASNMLPNILSGSETVAQRRNREIRQWIPYLQKYSKDFPHAKIIVCGSTGSVPATADLMECVYGLHSGFIIMPGNINSALSDSNCVLETSHPYFSCASFLTRVGIGPHDVTVIDNGQSPIDFLNSAFDNNAGYDKKFNIPNKFTRIDCAREAEEAEVVAEVAVAKSRVGKSVMIVSPDISAAQRFSESLRKRGAVFDFSGGTPASSTEMGRAILRLVDSEIENNAAGRPVPVSIYDEYRKSKSIFDAVRNLVGIPESGFDISDFTADYSADVWNALHELSDILNRHGLELNLSDIRVCVSGALSSVSIRPPMDTCARIVILGTMEARMQSADVVIMTGLNDGMFPATGYENPWLPRRISEQVGLPSGNRKVSLMALDFITLSCAAEVFWTRARTSGGGETSESRFLSRVSVASARAGIRDVIKWGDEWISAVRAQDRVPYVPLPDNAPCPPAISDDVYVTELELLVHNPYAFYVRHILRLRPKDDPDREPDARDFGNLVHSVIEDFGNSNAKITAHELVEKLDTRAHAILPKGSVIFHFWHRRFVDMADLIVDVLDYARMSEFAKNEIRGKVNISGRTVRAIADMILINGARGIVLDIKTGKAPTKKQLTEGNMPQLPIEAFIMQSGGFGAPAGRDVVLRFLQLQNRNIELIEYADSDAAQMIDAAVKKISELFGRYAKDFEPYEYYETSDEKYKAYDDLARR